MIKVKLWFRKRIESGTNRVRKTLLEVKQVRNLPKSDFQSSFDNQSSHEEMKWWGEISDLDRLNIMSTPIEDRARVLAAKISGTVEDTMLQMSDRTNLPYLQDFTISGNSDKVNSSAFDTFFFLPADYSTFD